MLVVFDDGPEPVGADHLLDLLGDALDGLAMPVVERLEPARSPRVAAIQSRPGKSDPAVTTRRQRRRCRVSLAWWLAGPPTDRYRTVRRPTTLSIPSSYTVNATSATVSSNSRNGGNQSLSVASSISPSQGVSGPRTWMLQDSSVVAS